MLTYALDQYVDEIASGAIPACKQTIAAVARHAEDIETGQARGLFFDRGAAQKAIGFFALLRHFEGEWAGRPIILEPWQQFIIGSLFGWKRGRQGPRRFRTALVSVGRKNGKSTLAAGVGLFGLVADNEPGAQIFTVATKRDQARIIHKASIEIARRAAPLVRDRIDIFRDNISFAAMASSYEPLGRDNKTYDGLNMHMGLCDEIHAWPDRDMWDVLDTSTGARRQSLLFGITTAGDSTASLWYDLDNYTRQVLDGVIEDDRHFGIIYELDIEEKDQDGKIVDPGDDFTDPAVWIKANPNLGVSKKAEDIAGKLLRVQKMPASMASFKRREFNITASGIEKWLNMDLWYALPRAAAGGIATAGRAWYGGLDLSTTTDITALIWIAPPDIDHPRYGMITRFFVPEDKIAERVQNDNVPYDLWLNQGYLIATDGNVTDYDYVLEQISDDKKILDVKELAFDRWGSQKIIADLQKDYYLPEAGGQAAALGFTVDPKVAKITTRPLLVQFGQGFASMAAPMKDLERTIRKGEIELDYNPVLTWHISNTIATVDAAGNIKPDKKKSKERIDGAVALIMAYDRASRYRPIASVYEDRDLRVL